MNRLYAIEATFTPTGAAADHRIPVRPRDLAAVLQGLLAAVHGAEPSGPPWVAAVARDLMAHSGRAVVIAGPGLPSASRAAVDALNAAIGAEGRTTWHAPSPLIGRQIPLQSLTPLVAALHSRAVDTLIVVGGNPSYATPAVLDFGSLLRSVPNAGYVGLYENETAHDVRWFIPMSHYLESWGEA